MGRVLWWTFVLSGFSRILAITVHLAFATLIILAYRRTWLFYPLAILVHFLVDFTTFGVQDVTGSLLWTLLVFALWAILALFLLVRIRRMDFLATDASSEHVESPSTSVTV